VIPEYAAGFFDADGCVGAYSRTQGTRPYVNVTVANNCHEVLEQFKLEYGGCIERRAGKKCMCWRITGSTTTRPFLTQILPFAVVKKEQIKLALEILDLPKFDRSTRAHHFELATRLKELKR
jgi:intein-encoded DNA endonuclease-like protein